MTKIFATLAAVVMMATISSAFTFNWGTGKGLTGRIQFGSGNYIAAAGDTANVANAAVYLVYLGADATWTFNEDGTTSDEVVQIGSIATTGLVGRGAETYGKPLDSSFTNGGTMEAGVATFSAFITYTVDGVTYYNFSSSTYTIPAGVEDQTPNPIPQDFTFKLHVQLGHG